jgi:hypothetical protein
MPRCGAPVAAAARRSVACRACVPTSSWLGVATGPWWPGSAERRAGEWRGLAVAIKAVLFQSTGTDEATALVASEAAIASNLVHRNLVATYSHDVRAVSGALDNELGTFKFYLVQVRLFFLKLLAEQLCFCLWPILHYDTQSQLHRLTGGKSGARRPAFMHLMRTQTPRTLQAAMP